MLDALDHDTQVTVTIVAHFRFVFLEGMVQHDGRKAQVYLTIQTHSTSDELLMAEPKLHSLPYQPGSTTNPPLYQYRPQSKTHGNNSRVLSMSWKCRFGLYAWYM